jgi:alanine or glycine:cation symporter, AGCS family
VVSPNFGGSVAEVLMDVTGFLQYLSGVIWGPVLLTLLLGTGVYLTLLLGGLQFRRLGRALKLVVTPNPGAGEGDITPFQALTTAMAATIGTGNIAGVATAVTVGGLGAIFWMWVAGLVGMALKYSEALLAVVFRVKNAKGQMAGGPMYYLERGMKWRFLAICFALFGLLASLGIGNSVQVHSIVDGMESTFGVTRWVTGLVLVAMVGGVVLGGIGIIGRVTSVLVPGMAAFYLLGGLVVIALSWEQVPGAIVTIFRSAFRGQAALGGFAGASAMLALRMGVARGIFSNEAGMGSASIAAAAAQTDQPARQALIAMTGTFIDTIVVCSITGLVLAVTGVLGTVEEGTLINGAPLTAMAFQSKIPGGAIVVTLGLVLFAYSTILGWAYYGEKCLEYLIGSRSSLPYRLFFTLITFAGAVLPLEMVWYFADVANGLMAFPNLLGLVGLSGVIVAETRRYAKNYG